MGDLARRECVPCRGGVPALGAAEIETLLAQLAGGWEVIRNHHLEKRFEFEDFRRALDFTNRVGELAEEQNHHPDIHLAWGKVRVTIWTHKIKGLHEADFVFAAKADALLE
ncbi:MAG: 4a-hydroxytetrahydrobiopterin dehydratase [Planctomycetota bacterium]